MLFNRSRAEEYLRRYGLDALVATTPVNVSYFSDYSCWVDPLLKEYMLVPGASSDPALQAYAVFSLEGEPALVLSPVFAVNAYELWVKDLYIFGRHAFDDSLPVESLPESERRIFDLLSTSGEHAGATEALSSVLGARGLTSGRLGIEMEGLAPGRREELERTLPRAELLDATNLLRLIRAVKSPDELARVTRAAEINEEISRECLCLAEPGVAMTDLADDYRARVAELGADFDHFAFGVHGLGIATEPSYVLRPSDVLYVDFGCVYKGYFSDSGRTLAITDVPPTLAEKHEALRTCVESGAATMRPGARASDVHAAMREALHAQGISASSPHGHSLGLEVREYPVVVAENGRRIRDDCIDLSSDLLLEQGMVINLEAALFFPGVASLHVEQSFLVVSSESRLLVPQDRQQPLVPSK